MRDIFTQHQSSDEALLELQIVIVSRLLFGKLLF
jgi:hypothetical protein